MCMIGVMWNNSCSEKGDNNCIPVRAEETRGESIRYWGFVRVDREQCFLDLFRCRDGF